MMRVLKLDTKSSFRDLEKWEHAIIDLIPEWQDIFRTTVFIAIGVSAEDERADDTDDAKALSIIEIHSEAERHQFFRYYRCVHTIRQDPHEENGEPPITGDHHSIASLDSLSEETQTEKQASPVLLVEMHGLNEYSSKKDAVYRVHMYMTESDKLIADEVAGDPVSDVVYDFRTDAKYFPLARYLRSKPSKTVHMTA